LEADIWLMHLWSNTTVLAFLTRVFSTTADDAQSQLASIASFEEQAAAVSPWLVSDKSASSSSSRFPFSAIAMAALQALGANSVWLILGCFQPTTYLHPCAGVGC
jgi:hypothetical protein